MNGGQPTVILVEDSLSLAAIYQDYLRDTPYRVEHFADGEQACERIVEVVPQLVLLDLMLPEMSGMEVLRRLNELGLPTEVVVITAHGSIDSAVEAMRYGAFDYLVKPFDAKRLRTTLENALERQQLRTIVATYQENDRDHYQGFIGASLSMQGVYRIIDAAAPSKATVFITGESGTGKEVCAQATHDLSPRAEGPFVTLNCAAIPRDLMESEIFGHVKGAFTGALAERVGAAGQADGGTLFLDEIGEMDLDLQSKLLRFLQTGTFTKVGASRQESVDVRIVCATNRDPLDEVKRGRFREDLYYRLHVIPIYLPPLRERDGDALLLAEYFLDVFAGEEGKPKMQMNAESRSLLANYDWPGNVRELQNVIRNVVVLNHGEVLRPDMVPPPVGLASTQTISSGGAESGQISANSSNSELPVDGTRPLWRIEKDAIEHAIALADGNIPRAAAMLEISPSTIYRKRQTWNEHAES